MTQPPVAGLHDDASADHPTGDHRVPTTAADARPLPTTVRITAMTSTDATPVLAIYRAALATATAALHPTVPTWGQFDALHLPQLRYVARDRHDTVLGWIAAGPVFTLAAPAPTIEHGIYVHPGARQRGIGRRLLDNFVAAATAAGVHRIRTGIFAANTASLALHTRAGFTITDRIHRPDPHHARRSIYVMELDPNTPTPTVPPTRTDRADRSPRSETCTRHRAPFPSRRAG